MDWKELRRDKLAKTASYKPTEARDGLWWTLLDRVGDTWARFMMLSWWEKAMIAGTGVLLAVLGPMALFALAGGGGAAPAPPPTWTQAPAVVEEPSPTPSPMPPTDTPARIIPTMSPTESPTEPATLLPDREDCDDIQGTAYRSESEREWYLEHCSAPVPPPPAPDDTATPGPGATNTPEPAISASEAAALAAQWIASNPGLNELDVSAGSCSAEASGDGWRVSCVATTTGCVGAACQIVIRVCVSEASIRQC